MQAACMLRRLVPAALALHVSCASPDPALAPEGIGAKGPPGGAASLEPCATADAGPVVEILRRGDFDSIAADDHARATNDDLIGTISNPNFRRFWNGTCGSYKVPVRIVTPKPGLCDDDGPLAGVGLVEFIGPDFIGVLPEGAASGVMQGWNDPVYDPLFDHGFQEAWANLDAWFLFGDPAHGGGGVVYMGFQANNFRGSLDYIASLPANDGLDLHLDEPEDYAIIVRDVSRWLRGLKTPDNFIGGDSDDVCEVSDVVGFGYSNTAMRLKAITANPHHLNSTWGSADPVFAGGLVLDGTLLGGAFDNFKFRQTLDTCRDVTATGAVPMPCAGPDDPSEGPMVIVNSETDVQISFRSPGQPTDPDHYKVHEVNAAAHLGSPYYPFATLYPVFGLDPSWTRQNDLDRNPVLRAGLVSLVDHIRHGTPLPPSAYIEAHAPITSVGWGIVSLDPSTGNGFGGIQLPQAAAPLGLYRGIDCHAFDFDVADPYHYAHPPTGSGDLTTGRAAYVLESGPHQSPGMMCGSIEGLFTPYSTVDEALGTTYCADLYPTREAYSDRVVAAADHLIAQRYLLPEERDRVIEAAEAAADAFPDCVPPR